MLLVAVLVLLSQQDEHSHVVSHDRVSNAVVGLRSCFFAVILHHEGYHLCHLILIQQHKTENHSLLLNF